SPRGGRKDLSTGNDRGCNGCGECARSGSAGGKRMGPRLTLPPYVHAFIDRHGKARYYFRRVGFKCVPLPGLPWAPEFMAAYEPALAGQPAPIGADCSTPANGAPMWCAWAASTSTMAPSLSVRLRRAARYGYQCMTR